MSESPKVIRGKNCEFGQVVYRPKGRYGPLVQDYFQLVLIQSGEAIVSTRDVTVNVKPTQCILLPVNEEYQIEFSPAVDTAHSWCLMKRPYVRKLGLNSKLEHSLEVASNRLNQLVSLAFDLMETGIDHQDPYFDCLAESTLREYILMASRARDSFAGKQIQEAKAFIERNLHRPLTVDLIASASGMSRQHLSKLFRDHIDEPVASYLWRRRVESVHALLMDTGLSIAEIAEQTGFQTQFHLSRRFKDYYGCPPRALRRDLRRGLVDAL